MCWIQGTQLNPLHGSNRACGICAAQQSCSRDRWKREDRADTCPSASQEHSNTCWNLLYNTHLSQTTQELTLNWAQFEPRRDKAPTLHFQNPPRLPQCSCIKLCHKCQQLPRPSQALSAPWDPCEHNPCCPHHAQAQPSDQLGQPKSTVPRGRAAQAPHSLLPPTIPPQLHHKSE